MKNTFYKPEPFNRDDAQAIISKLKNDLDELTKGAATKEEELAYARKLAEQGWSPEGKNDWICWGLDDPKELPTDARVEFFYLPTYLAVAILALTYVKYQSESLLKEELEDALRGGLNASAGRSFMGAGYDDIDGLLDAMEIFAKGRLNELIRQYPNLSLDFTKKLMENTSLLEDGLKNGALKGPWGEDYTDKAKDVLYALQGDKGLQKVFVYGTLLKGNSNHDYYLDESNLIGEAVLEGYALYELGSYPGVKRMLGQKVKGEVYEVDDETLQKLNYLEGEGSLYALEWLPVMVGGKLMEDVGVYVYLHDVDEAERVPYNRQPWGRDGDKVDLVWYVAYGSNMLYERLMCYFKGKSFRGNGRASNRCVDATPPRERKNMLIPYNMYYANRSGSWEGKGVSFLDPTREGWAYGVAYLISREQFEHLYREENGGFEPASDSSWYNFKLDLGLLEGLPAMTITNRGVLPMVEPGERYVGVLLEGLRENYLEMSEDEIVSYLESRND